MGTVRKQLIKWNYNTRVMTILTTSNSSAWQMDQNVNTGDVCTWYVEGGGITPRTYTGTAPIMDFSANTGTVEIKIVSPSLFEGFTTLGTLVNVLEITSIDFSQNIYLDRLYLAGGNPGLTSIDIADYNLDSLRIDQSGITSIDVSHMSLLRVFTLNDCDFSGGVDITNNPLMQYFFADRASLPSIDISNNLSLIALDIADNPDITGVIDLSLYTAMTRVTLTDCTGITGLICNAAYNFEFIYVQGCSFTVEALNQMIVSIGRDKSTYGKLYYDQQTTGAEPTGTSDAAAAVEWGGDVYWVWESLKGLSWSIIGAIPTVIINPYTDSNFHMGRAARSPYGSKAAVAAGLGVTSNDLNNFFVDSMGDIHFRLDLTGRTFSTSFRANNIVTYFLDLDGRVGSCTGRYMWLAADNARYFYFPNSQWNGGGGLNQRGFRQNGARIIYFPRASYWGTADYNNQNFLSMDAPSTLYAYMHLNNLTSNAGGIELDMNDLRNQIGVDKLIWMDPAASPAYDANPPSPVTDLAVSSITTSSCVITFSTPASTNGLHPLFPFEVWRNGGFLGWYQSGATIPMIQSADNQELKVVAFDSLANRSTDSNVVSINTKI